MNPAEPNTPIFLTHHPHRFEVLETTGDAAIEISTHRGSGPGGQKRNKTSSAVRATHLPTGLSAISDDSRDQRKNRETAVRRLAHVLTVRCRKRVYLDRLDPPEEFNLETSQKAAPYLPTLGHVLDVLQATGYVLNHAATYLSTTTGQLSKFITRDPHALAYVNAMRQSLSLKPLSPRS